MARNRVVKPRVVVKRASFNKKGETLDRVVIRNGPHYVLIPFDEARRVVDAVHDACDAYESEQRGVSQE